MLSVLTESPMEQHPVPQHIASYEFRLVGDMTLKQFSLLASGGVVALIFYASPLPGYFKWPTVIFFAFLGFALAFLPIQERPLGQWIIAFAKAVFSPTQYLWERKAKKLEVLQYTPKKRIARQTPAAPPDKAQVSAYLKTLPPEPGKSPIEQQEENYLRQISQLFKAPTKSVPSTPVFPTTTSQTAPPRPKPAPTVEPFKKPIVKAVTSEPTMVKTGRKVILPEKPGRIRRRAVPAKTSAQLPIPAPPTQPNLLVGMVLDRNGEMIEGAIIEIRNSKGVPVRALKTNKLGQFRIATPLPTDTYEIETEKEDYQFDIIKIALKGEVVMPLEIRAK